MSGGKLTLRRPSGSPSTRAVRPLQAAPITISPYTDPTPSGPMSSAGRAAVARTRSARWAAMSASANAARTRPFRLVGLIGLSSVRGRPPLTPCGWRFSTATRRAPAAEAPAITPS